MQEQPEAPKTKQSPKPAEPNAPAKQPEAAEPAATTKQPTPAKPAATPSKAPATKVAPTKPASPKAAAAAAAPSPKSDAAEKNFLADATSKKADKPDKAAEQAKVSEPKPEVEPKAKPVSDASSKPEPEVEAATKDPAAKAEAEAASKPAAKDEADAHDEIDSIAEVAAAMADAEDAAEEMAESFAEDVEQVLAETAEEDAEAKAALETDATEEGAPAPEAEPEPEAEAEPEPEAEAETEPEPETELPQPRRSVAFIGSECYPFVKTGGLGDVMYSLPKALIAQNCDVKVILPNYGCIKQEYKDKMVYRGSFDMDLCSDGRSFYVGIMEYVWDGVVYDFIDNEEFFSYGNPYTNLVDDIPKFCYFDKAALAALNYMNWVPDIIHCHDWQASLVPIYLRTMFEGTPVSSAKTILTIHNLRFQGVYNIPTIKYWTNLPDYVFNKDVLQEFWTEANMLKGGLTYANMITTVSNTYAGEIQTPEYGEGLDAHLRYHSGKLRGIVNGIDYDLWNPATDKYLEAPYDISDVLEKKRQNKLALQKELGLEQDENKMLIGLVSRLTNQKGLDLVNTVLPALIDGNTQVAVLGTGDPDYENSFRYYEDAYRGSVCSSIMYDEGRAHKIYAGADALLVPSRFEPCGLTQLIAMHYGTVPIVRETGGLKDTVQPYNKYNNDGNGFTFDRYEPGLLYDAVNRAKTLYFTNRWCWDEMVQRDMDKDVSWENSARQYRWLYLELTS